MTGAKDCQRFESLLDRVVQEDGALTPGEELFLEQHRGECDGCALSADLLDELRNLDHTAPALLSEDPAVQAQARKLVAAGASRPQATRGISRKYSLAAGLIAAAVILILVWTSHQTTGLPEDPASTAQAFIIRADDGVSIAARAAVTGTTLGKGDVLDVGSGSALVQLANGSTVRLEDGALFSLKAITRDRTTLRLDQGIAFLVVHPFPGGRTLVLDTPAGQLLALDTTFAAQITGAECAVAVAQGTVSLELPVNTAAEVPAGQLYRSGHGFCDMHADRQEAMVVAGRADQPLPPGAMECTQLARLEPAAPLVEREHQPVLSSPVAVHVQAAEPVAAAASEPSMEMLLDTVRRCRLRGDWSGAAGAYAQLIGTYPGTEEALTSHVLLGWIQLEHLGRPQAALESFEAYLRGAQTGPLREEAEWGMALALSELGRQEEERAALQAFIEHNEGSLHATEAAQRLGKLRGEQP